MKIKVLFVLVMGSMFSLNCNAQGLKKDFGLGIISPASFSNRIQRDLNRNSENGSFHIFNSVYIPAAGYVNSAEPPKYFMNELSNKSAGISKQDPKAEKVLRDFVLAIGGEKAVSRIENRVSKVDVVFVESGIVLNKEIIEEKSNKTYIKAFAPQFGEMIRGFDGEVLWEKRQSDVRVLYDDEKNSFLNESAFLRFYTWKKNLADLEYSGIEKINGTDLHKLSVKTNYGSKEIWYFSTENNLLVRIEEHLVKPQGEFTAITTFEDYRELDGVFHPYLQNIYIQGQTRKIVYTNIKHNQVFDSSIFSKPEEE